MSKETPTITAELRERTGSRYSRRLRSAGKLPAVLYGHGSNPVSISVDEIEIIRHLTEGAHVVELDIEGMGKETCLIKDLQFGWLGDNVIHMDLAKVDLDEVVTVNIRVVYKGTPASLKQAGAVLTQDISELEISCKVRDIPEEIVVDMDGMEESLTIGEVTLPEGVTAVAGPNTTMCHIFIKAEEPDEPVEGAEDADPAAEAAASEEPASED